MPDSKPKKPLQERSRQTVEDILSASARILEVKPEKDFNTNRIAETAGYSIGALYRFFPDKSAIIEALARREEENVIAKLNRILESEDDVSLERAIRAMVHIGIAAFQGRRRLRRFIILQVVKLNLSKWAFMRMEITGKIVVEIVRRYGGDRVRPLSEASAFVFSRSLMLTIRASVMEEKDFIDDPEFEDELVRQALAFVLKS